MTGYRFNGVHLDSANRRLLGPHGAVHLPPKPYGVLVELLRSPAVVVTREALLARVWPERPASDEVLSRTVTELRKLLGDDPRSPRYIETVPKLGYRLLPSVEQLDSEAAAAPAAIDASGGNSATAASARPARWQLTATAVVVVVACLALVAGSRQTDATRTSPASVLPLSLTSEIGDEDTPAFSPDGNFLAYAARARGDENWDLRLRELATGATVDLVNGPAREYAPAFAPDGRRIAFLRYRGEHCQVMVRALDGPERALAACRTPMMAYVDWSPDGSAIAYSDTPRQGGALLALRAVDVRTGESAAITAPPPDRQYQFMPRYSPDGSRLAYIQGGLDANEVWLRELPHGTAHRVTAMQGRITGLDWSGDGTVLYFGTAEPAEPALWRMVPGRDPERVRDGATHVPAIDAVQGRLAFDQIRARTNIWSVQPDWSVRHGTGAAVDAVRRIASTRNDDRPAISPDGQRLAFVSDRSGHSDVWLADAHAGEPRRLTQLDAAAISRPDWSPDARHLVYAALHDGRWTGYIHPLDGGAPRRIAAGDRELRHPLWSRDGQWILYAAADGIRRMAPGSWREEVVLEGAGAVPLSQDADVLYYLQPGRAGVQRRGRDGRITTLLGSFELVVPEAVSVTASHVYFIGTASDDSARRLFGYALDSGVLAPLLPVVSYTRHAHLSVAHDTGAVWFSQADETDSDLQVIALH